MNVPNKLYTFPKRVQFLFDSTKAQLPFLFTLQCNVKTFSANHHLNIFKLLRPIDITEIAITKMSSNSQTIAPNVKYSIFTNKVTYSIDFFKNINFQTSFMLKGKL